MTTEQLPKATHVGELKIGEVTIPCAVLEDGRRVLTTRGIYAAIGEGTPGRGRESTTVGNLPPFMASDRLEPYFKAHSTTTAIEPIRYRPRGNRGGGNIGHGYDARILPVMCEVWLKAREAGALHYKQAPIAARAEQIVRALAHIGILALVDEATGYQQDRQRDELQQILAAYLAPEMRPWVKEFPDEYYEGIFRLLGWKYTPDASSRPGFVGHLTNLLVYERMPEGVLAVLRERNPTTSPGRRAAKHHQHLSADFGRAHLRQHLAVLCAFMRASTTWVGFVQNVQAAYPKAGDQLPLFILEDWLREQKEPSGGE
jgi:hypothetical protein